LALIFGTALFQSDRCPSAALERGSGPRFIEEQT
jgi:hypothetical protein